jgi:NAD(P)-dependent dehydrogenase (short-subunit alcohol dehydrogenase family)
MSEFRGKNVLITGAGRGVGRQTARDFGADGANVCVGYVSSVAEAKETVKAINSSGGNAFACKANISDSKEVGIMVEATVDKFGGIDVYVNTAGLSIDGPFLEMNETDWDRVYEVNLKGAFLVSQAVARHMVVGNGGVIVHISSDSSTTGRPNAANYCSSKAGLNMLTKCMALELAPKVRVNGIGLGFMESPLVHEVYSSDELEEALKSVPLGRMTTLEETSAFIRLLASKSTAFVTGQTIMFDGGEVMR